MIRLITRDELEILDKDPVRPHINKLEVGKQVYVLDDLSAVICICYCTQVPTTEEELEKFRDDTGSIAVAYTVWSNKQGAGRAIVNELLELMKAKDGINRLVTMSPLTEMAKKFHTRNGAILLLENTDSYNFEYLLG
jgi:Zn-finger protein